MKSITTIGLLTAALTLTACGPSNEGFETQERIESRKEVGPNLGSADLQAASDKAVASIARVPGIRTEGEKTVIVMDTVTNRTSDPSADFQIYLARIRASLNQSGQRQDLVFVETRHKAVQIKEREGYPTEATARTLPRYALTATFYDLPRGRTNYYLLTFQLVDLTNDIIAWEDSYEVKL